MSKMSSSSSNASNVHDESRTIFAILPDQFPDANEKIKTKQFLQAATGVLFITEKIGKVFTPITYYMHGNIKKLTDRFNEDPEAHKFLEDMILKECAQREITATDALMWLRRSMYFVTIYFQSVIKDTESDRCSQDLSSFVKKAYTESLEPYHGWLGTQLFNVLSRFCPNRKTLLFLLGLDSHNKEAIVLRDMRIYTQKMSAVVAKLTDFYNQNNLETFDPV